MADQELTKFDETEIQVFWSSEDQEFVAVHPRFPSLSFLDPERNQAEQGMRLLLLEVIADLENERSAKTSGE